MIYLKKLYQKKNMWVNIESPAFIKELTISITLLKRVHVWLLKEQLRKICVFVSTSRPHEQNRFTIFWKLSLNFYSRKILKPRSSPLRYLLSLQLCNWESLFGDGLINLNKLLLKIRRLQYFKDLDLAWSIP